MGDPTVELVELKNSYKMLKDLYCTKKAENEQLRKMNKILYETLLMRGVRRHDQDR